MSERGRPLSSAERGFFLEFFGRLDRAGIVAIVLRNYENFPDAIGHDLDVFFRRADWRRSVGVFRETLSASGGELLHIHERDYVFAVWFRVRPDEPKVIHLDFYHGAFTWHGLPYLRDDELIGASVRRGDFRVPRPAHEALSLFLTSLLWGAFYKVRYGHRIAALLAAPEESAEFERILEKEFGPTARPPFAFAGSQAPAPESARHYARQLRSALKRRSFLRQPFAAVFRMGRYWLGEWKTVVAPPAICIAILGPDGAGKSTVIQAVKDRIGYYFGETVDRHWRPQWLRDAGVALRRRAEHAGPVTDPHGRKPHSLLVSAARFFYYWLDYWLGWPPRVWKFKAKNHLVIFDRYAQDMWCDPKRYRLRLPRGLMNWLCRCVPQPEMTFVLLADAEVIQQRKGEVPLETLSELLLNYREAAAQHGRVQAVDCSRPVQEVADEITDAVLDRLRARSGNNRRFRQY